MRRIKLDMDGLIEAMLFHDPNLEMIPYLDLETGEVVEKFTGPDLEEDDEQNAEIEARPDRYLEVPTIESHEQYDWMARFAESVEEEDLRDQIFLALRGKGAFGRFRDVVERYQDLRRRWHEMRTREALREALGWLRTEEIEPVYELRPFAEPERLAKEDTVKILLEHVLVLGAPEGKTEIIDGRVTRRVGARTPDEARSIFKTLARNLCDYKGLPWRNRHIEGKPEFELEGIAIRIDGTIVEVQVTVPPQIVDRFYAG